MTQQDLEQLANDYANNDPGIATIMEDAFAVHGYEAGFKKALELVSQLPITAPIAEMIIKFQELI